MRLSAAARSNWFVLAFAAVLASLAADQVYKTGTGKGWRQHDRNRPNPPVVEPAEGLVPLPAPKDAIVLFHGSNLDAWRKPGGAKAGWKVEEGYFEVSPGAGVIETKQKFGDVQIHLEWASPSPAKGMSQDRGNSGLFLMDRYELQILDSYQSDTYADGQAGAIYGQYPPLANATRPPGEWQTYDIAFRRPRVDEDGKVTEPARVTLIHNGIVVQNNEEILGGTSWIQWSPFQSNHPDKASLRLQDHGHKVKFRNIWVRELVDRPLPTTRTGEPPKVLRLSSEQLDQYVGTFEDLEREREQWIFSHEGTQLIVKNGARRLEPVPVAEGIFLLPNSHFQVTFLKNDQGVITKAALVIGGDNRSIVKTK